MSQHEATSLDWSRPRRIVVQPRCGTEHCTDCDARHSSLCGVLDDHDISRLAALAQQMVIPAGHGFIEDGAAADSFYNVTSGTARLYKLLPDGRRQITGFAGPGHFLGLAVSTHYAFAAEAIDDVSICRFSRVRLKALLTDLPSLERRLLDVASNELVLAQEQMLLLGRKTARERLASFLTHLLTDATISPGGSAHVHLPMPRADIADYIGLTVETVSRSFGWLKSEGLVVILSATELRICDVAGLRALADGSH
jgi:CRP/FNR family transcriptional regulator